MPSHARVTLFGKSVIDYVHNGYYAPLVSTSPAGGAVVLYYAIVDIFSNRDYIDRYSSA